jgi:hypothetical protein
MRLLTSGGERDDPRAIGMAHVLLGYLSISSDDPVAAAAHGRECQRVALAAFERLHGAMSTAAASVFLGNPREGLAEMEALHSEFELVDCVSARDEGRCAGIFGANFGGDPSDPAADRPI